MSDVIVIGSGQAGVPLAARLAEAGKSVVLVEAAELGGTCVNDGCTPTKTMLASARAAHVARGAGRLGVRTGDVTVDLGAVVDRKDKIVQQWRDGVDRRLSRAGASLQVRRGRGRFVEAHEIDVAGERYGAATIIVNVGCRPAAPPLPGLDRVPWLDNRSGELIHVFVVLMQAGRSARALVDAECVHPTFAEGLQTLVMRLKRYAL